MGAGARARADVGRTVDVSREAHGARLWRRLDSGFRRGRLASERGNAGRGVHARKVVRGSVANRRASRRSRCHQRRERVAGRARDPRVVVARAVRARRRLGRGRVGGGGRLRACPREGLPLRGLLRRRRERRPLARGPGRIADARVHPAPPRLRQTTRLGPGHVSPRRSRARRVSAAARGRLLRRTPAPTKHAPRPRASPTAPAFARVGRSARIIRLYSITAPRARVSRPTPPRAPQPPPPPRPLPPPPPPPSPSPSRDASHRRTR